MLWQGMRLITEDLAFCAVILRKFAWAAFMPTSHDFSPAFQFAHAVVSRGSFFKIDMDRTEGVFHAVDIEQVSQYKHEKEALF